MSSHYEIAEPGMSRWRWISRSSACAVWTQSPRRRSGSSAVGLGIPSGDRRRIFDKFYRLDPNLARGVGGTGLGLYICRELVRRMDGSIWVESREGEASRFTFELPAADRQPATARSGLAGRSGSPERSF